MTTETLTAPQATQVAQPMETHVEVWLLAADSKGIWLVNGAGGPWRSGPVMDDTDPERVAIDLLREHGELDATMVRHSTCWRPKFDDAGRSRQLDTFVAVVGGFGHVDRWRGDFTYVLDIWLDAQPVGIELAGKVGRPAPHGAAGIADPRDIDVLWHAIRHLCFLLHFDADVRAALDDHWRRWLGYLEPTLAGLYQRPLGGWLHTSQRWLRSRYFRHRHLHLRRR